MGSRGATLRGCWNNRRLRRALAAYLIFNVNEWGSYIALLVYAYEMHGVRGASILAVVQLVPSTVLASPAAARLGRMRAPSALRLGYAAQAASTLGLGMVMLLGAPFPLVCALAAVAAVCITFTRPVHYALLPEVSDTVEELTAGNAGSGAVEAVAAFVGPLVSGLVAAWWAPGGVMVAMGAASAVSVLLATGLGPGIRRFLASGDRAASVRAVMSDPSARLLSLLVGAEYVLVGALDILLVVLAFDVLDMSTSGPGLLNSALGVGNFVGALLTVLLIGARRIVPALLAGSLVAGSSIALVGVTAQVPSAMLLIALAGSGKLLFDVSIRTFVQRVLPDRLLVAVFGLQESAMMAGLTLGVLIAPVAVEVLGPAVAFVVAGGFLPLVAVAGWWRLNRLDAGTVVPVDRLTLLRGVAVLAPLPPRVLERLALFSGRTEHESGERIVVEGQSGDLFYVIQSGEVSVSHGEQEVRRLASGDWFGELALLGDGKRTATVTAQSSVAVLTVDRDSFVTALAGTPSSRAVADEHARSLYR